MAFLHRGIGDKDPGSSFVSTALLKTIRWAAVPCIGIALASWSAATLAGLHSAASLAYAGTLASSPLSIEAQLRQLPPQAKPATNGKKMLVAPVEKPVSMASLSMKPTKPRLAPAAQAPAARPSADPFGKVVAEAKLSREKLHAAFARAGMAIEEASAVKPVEVALAMPSAERFHSTAAKTKPHTAPAKDDSAADPLSPLALGTIGQPGELAYASAETSPDSPVKLALASLALDPYGMGEDGPEADEDYMPDTVELPPARPEASPAKPEGKPAKAEAKPERKPVETADEPARKPAKADKQQPEQALAYARPDKPTIGAFKNLFNNTPKAGKRVAVYDISAAVVYMPDGSKLEAHSGIGKMADNPRYVHVKMNGPTPPNTYKLSMREKRFHGVEAVRMTPIGNQSMHGRDGILAHSYLLRGGREESHGCVAFANYPQFLKAFKQGKVTHIVVVPSMSGTSKVRLAAMGRGA